VFSQLAILKPKYIVLAFYVDDDHFTFDRSFISRADYAAALTQTIRTLKAVTSNVLLFGRIPRLSSDAKVCASLHPSALQQCGTGRGDALLAATEALMKNAASLGRGKYLDLMHFGCTATSCPPVINNTLAYSDRYHYSMHYFAEIQNLVITEIHALGIR